VEGKYAIQTGARDLRSVQLYSYEQGNNIRGAHPTNYFHLDEVGDCPQYILKSVLIPTSKENTRIICTGTVKGHNDLYYFYLDKLNDPDWGIVNVTAEHPFITTPERQEFLKRQLGEATYREEYMNDFEATSLLGSVFGSAWEEFAKHRVSNFVCWNPNYPVYTAWDIGWTDYTAIWFFQIIDGQPRFIDFYENNQKLVDYYVAVTLSVPASQDDEKWSEHALK
jgi:hypothetical protein